MPDDPALIVSEGRGREDRRFPKIGRHAQTFFPDEVAELSAALNQITDAGLREHFDPRVMESLGVAGILWTEEEPDVFEKILVPVLERIRELFRLAAQAGQTVIVVIW
ncbi:MAG TPA: DUF1877 family protein [Rhizomicrobium sp.]|jgi:hypothetical protein|nr:DUF1877 family protein [Rhizomicrobium sp.]